MNRETANKAPSRIASLRKSLGLSQQQAAKLLNISKNTWIRWEHKQFKPDELALELLPVLARKSIPDPCYDSRARRYDPEWLAKHVPDCPDCRLSLKYILIVGQL
jgi:transcriptional regulator with XRE-family HTH domain